MLTHHQRRGVAEARQPAGAAAWQQPPPCRHAGQRALRTPVSTAVLPRAAVLTGAAVLPGAAVSSVDELIATSSACQRLALGLWLPPVGLWLPPAAARMGEPAPPPPPQLLVLPPACLAAPQEVASARKGDTCGGEVRARLKGSADGETIRAE